MDREFVLQKGWGIAQSVESKCENQSFHPPEPTYMAACACNPSTGEAEKKQCALGPTDQAA